MPLSLWDIATCSFWYRTLLASCVLLNSNLALFKAMPFRSLNLLNCNVAASISSKRLAANFTLLSSLKPASFALSLLKKSLSFWASSFWVSRLNLSAFKLFSIANWLWSFNSCTFLNCNSFLLNSNLFSAISFFTVLFSLDICFFVWLFAVAIPSLLTLLALVLAIAATSDIVWMSFRPCNLLFSILTRLVCLISIWFSSILACTCFNSFSASVFWSANLVSYLKSKDLFNLSNNVFKPYSDFCKSIACFCLSSCK